MAYVFVHDGAQWVQQARIGSDDFSQDRIEYFARNVDISGNTLVLGTKTKVDDLSAFTGLAYVFTRQGNTWQLQAKLTPPQATDISFADGLAIDGDTLAVTGIGEDYTSAVYVFQRDPTTNTWTYQDKLLSPDRCDYFGGSVDISKDTIVVGGVPYRRAGGCVHVFVRNSASHTWSHQAELHPRDDTFRQGFGHSVAIDQDTIVVGASSEGQLLNVISFLGSAYIYHRNPGSQVWNQEARLKPRGTRHWFGWYEFGASTAIHSNHVLVGTQEYGDNAAYLFSQMPLWGWRQRAKIVPELGESFNAISIDASDQYLVIGGSTKFDQDGTFRYGKFYVFDLHSG